MQVTTSNGHIITINIINTKLGEASNIQYGSVQYIKSGGSYHVFIAKPKTNCSRTWSANSSSKYWYVPDGAVSLTVDTGTKQSEMFVVLDDVESDVENTVTFNNNTCTVYFNANGGQLVNPSGKVVSKYSKTVTQDGTIGSLPSATKEGSNFIGWFDDPSGGSQITEQTTVAGDATVYAHWDDITYTVRYSPGSYADTDYPHEDQKTYNVSLALSDAIFTRTGYRQDGWSTEDGGGLTYSLSALYETNAAITLYPHWRPIQFTVTFNANNGSGMMDNETCVYGEGQKLTKNTFSRSYYTFLGWSTDSSATSAKYNDESSVESLGAEDGVTINLYAIWDRNKYSVTFRAGSAPVDEGSNSSEKILEGYPGNVVSVFPYTIFDWTGFSWTGHTFTGWSLGFNKDAQEVTIGDSNQYYSAQWQANTYTVTFDANGGTGTMADQSFTYDVAQALTANAFTRTGYKFMGWATTAAGSKVYSDKQKVSNLTAVANGTVPLYAVWQVNQYTVTFDANGGKFEDGTTADKQVTQDYGTGLSAPTVTRTGCGFTGWHESVPSTMPAQNTTYTAQWVKYRYTATFKANGGNFTDGTTADKQVTQEYETKLTAPIVKRTGWKFTGWSSKVPSTMPAQNTTYTAQWVILQYTATFDANGGEGGMSVTQDYGTTLDAPMVTRTGYTWTGWNPPVPDTMPAEGTTYKAQWEKNTYTVTFDKNSPKASGTMADESFTYDVAQALTANAFTRTGYKFLGWAKTSGATSYDYYNKQSVRNLTATANGTVPLYAVWKENFYDVGFDNLFSFYEWTRSDSCKLSGYGGRLKADDGKTADLKIFPQGNYHVYTNYGEGNGYYNIEAAANTEYAFSCKLTGNAPTSEVYWVALDSNRQIIKDGNLPYRGMGTSNGVVKYKKTFTTPAGCAFVQLFFDVHNTDAATENNYENFLEIRLRKSADYADEDAIARAAFMYSDTDGRKFGKLITPKREGYSFAGWIDDQGNTVGANTPVLSYPRCIHLTSKWNRKVWVNLVAKFSGNSAFSGSTDIPDGWDADSTVAQMPMVKVGKSGTVRHSVSDYSEENVTISIYASKVARGSSNSVGLTFARFEVNDEYGNSVVKNANVENDGDMKKLSFTIPAVKGTPVINATAYYTRDTVNAYPRLSSSSGGLSDYNPISVDPAAPYSFADTVDFQASDIESYGYYFYGWSEDDSIPARPSANHNPYAVTLMSETTTLYAHYARRISVIGISLDSEGAIDEGVGGTFSVTRQGEKVGDQYVSNGFPAPLGGTIAIIGTASSGFRFAGIEFMPQGGSEYSPTEWMSGQEFSPTANGTYRIRFQRNPPYKYLVCGDKARIVEDESSGTFVAESGSTGTTIAEYGDAAEQDETDPDFIDVTDSSDARSDLWGGDLPDGYRCYKVRAGTAVVLKAFRSSASDALEWVGSENNTIDKGGEVASIIASNEGPGNDTDPQRLVWRNRSFMVVRDTMFVSVWGRFDRPKVVIRAGRGGNVRFAKPPRSNMEPDGMGEAITGRPFGSEREFPSVLDSETGLYSYESVTVIAEPEDGFFFAGWVQGGSMTVSNSAKYTVDEVRADLELTAIFQLDDNAVFAWEGSDTPKTMEWTSGVIMMPMPGDPVAARVDATGYPVEIDVGTYSSPYAEPTRQHAVEINGQAARRLPRMRAERFWLMSVRSSAEVDSMTVATNITEAN